MNIPKKFNLLGQTITVEINNRNAPTAAGKSFFQKGKIVLYKKAHQSRDQLEQTFLHEVFHFVFLYVNATEPIQLADGTRLCLDERTVDTAAALFQQVLKSGKIVK